MTRKEAEAKAYDYLDQVVDIYETREFFEVTGRRGGDVLTFRFYHNGMVTER